MQLLAELDELYTNVNNDIKSINQTLYNADDQDWIDELLNKTQYSLSNLQGEFSDDELKILATLDIDKNTTMEQLHEIIDNLQLLTKEGDPNSSKDDVSLCNLAEDTYCNDGETVEKKLADKNTEVEKINKDIKDLDDKKQDAATAINTHSIDA